MKTVQVFVFTLFFVSTLAHANGITYPLFTEKRAYAHLHLKNGVLRFQAKLVKNIRIKAMPKDNNEQGVWKNTYGESYLELGHNIAKIFYHHSPTYSGYFAVTQDHQVYQLEYSFPQNETNHLDNDAIISLEPLRTLDGKENLYLRAPLLVWTNQGQVKLTSESGRTRTLHSVLPVRHALKVGYRFEENGSPSLGIMPQFLYERNIAEQIGSSYPLHIGPNIFSSLLLTLSGDLLAQVRGANYLQVGSRTFQSQSVAISLAANIQHVFYHHHRYHSGYLAVSKGDKQIFVVKTRLTTNSKNESRVELYFEPLLAITTNLVPNRAVSVFLDDHLSPVASESLRLKTSEGQRISLNDSLYHYNKDFDCSRRLTARLFESGEFQ